MRAPLLFGTAAGAAAWSFPALAPIAPPVASALDLRRRIDEPGAVALTFDDGPHPAGTPAILEELRQARAKGSFFLCGEQVERYPQLAAEIVAEGHSIALHGQRHRVQLRLTPSQIADDLDRGSATIEDATGFRPAIYRPPLGIFSFPGLRAVRDRGLESLLWSRWGHDWRHRPPQAIAAELTEDLQAGDVLLLHDADHYSARECWRGTAAALPAVLEAIEAAGLRPAAL
jgi:peptidoglycan/xylan/chitin deacetylase (PgdA/CDA1 family)